MSSHMQRMLMHEMRKAHLATPMKCNGIPAAAWGGASTHSDAVRVLKAQPSTCGHTRRSLSFHNSHSSTRLHQQHHASATRSRRPASNPIHNLASPHNQPSFMQNRHYWLRAKPRYWLCSTRKTSYRRVSPAAGAPAAGAHAGVWRVVQAGHHPTPHPPDCLMRWAPAAHPCPVATYMTFE